MGRLAANGQREFTLLHLAAVFVGLGILSSMILPPTILTGGVRERARRANCLSNLKQIGIALEMYAEQYQGRLPVDHPDKPTLVGCMKLLSNELTSTKVYACPSSSDRQASRYEELSITNISYSYVPNLMWHSPQSTNPPAIVMLDRIGTLTAANSRWPRTGNHKDTGGNVLFNDGHVAFSGSLPSDLKDKDGKAIVLSP